MESLTHDGQSREAIDLLTRCEESLLEPETDLEHFFRVVARVRTSIESPGLFDTAFQQLVFRASMRLIEADRRERAFKLLDEARRKCGEMLEHKEGRNKLYRLFRARDRVVEAATVLVDDSIAPDADLRKTLTEIIETSDDPDRLLTLAEEADIAVDADRSAPTDGAPPDRLPVPGGLGDEETAPGAPCTSDDGPDGLQRAPETTTSGLEEPTGLGDEPTLPNSHPGGATPDDGRRLEATTTAGRLYEVALMVEDVDASSLVTIESRQPGTDRLELPVEAGRLAPVWRCGEIVAVAPDTDPGDDCLEVVQRLASADFAPDPSPSKQPLGAVLVDVLDDPEAAVEIRIEPLDSLDESFGRIQPATLLEQVGCRQTAAMPDNARRVWRIAEAHRFGRWRFTAMTAQPASPWLPVDRADTGQVDIETIAGFGRRLRDMTATTVELDEDSETSARLTIFVDGSTMRAVAADDSGGCLVDIKDNLLAPFVRTGRPAFEKPGDSS